jgi:hypothetical protein
LLGENPTASRFSQSIPLQGKRGIDSAHHHRNLRRLGSSVRYFSASCPSTPNEGGPTQLAISPPVELAAQGCGYGYRRTRWQDDWGRWHRGHCWNAGG